MPLHIHRFVQHADHINVSRPRIVENAMFPNRIAQHRLPDVSLLRPNARVIE